MTTGSLASLLNFTLPQWSQNPDNVWLSLLTIVISTFLFDLYVDYRQHRQISRPKRPIELEGICSEEEYSKSRDYTVERSRFDILTKLVHQLLGLTLLFGGGLSFAWFAAEYVLKRFGTHWMMTSEICTSLAFQGLLTIFSELIDIPFDVYQTFFIEAKHGFNKTTIHTFITDKIKSLILTSIIGSVVISAIIWLIKQTGPYLAISVCGFLLLFQFVMILIYPTLIQPLFNKFTPLNEGPLRQAIELLAKKVEFPLKDIYIMDGSKRSSHSNAYFFGFKKNKRIVLFDTLVDQMSTEEITAVVAHELGHWNHNHMLKGLVMVQINILVIFVLFSLVMSHQPLYSAFGFENSRPIIVGLTLFLHLLSPFSLLMTFLASFLSRCREFEADRFAITWGYGPFLPNALIKLYKENKHLVHPDWLYSALHYSHPPPSERIATMKKSSLKTSRKQQ